MMCYTGATNKEWVAKQMANDHSLQTEVKKYFGYKSYAEDILQDIILQILQLENETKLIKACHNNQFNFWLFSRLKNQKTNASSYSSTHYKNQIEFEQTDDIFEKTAQNNQNDYIYTQEQEHKEYIVNLLKAELSKINKENWYRALVFTKYAELKEQYEHKGEKLTFSKFGKEMNIDKDSLWQIIKKVKQQLKNRIQDEL